MSPVALLDGDGAFTWLRIAQWEREAIAERIRDAGCSVSSDKRRRQQVTNDIIDFQAWVNERRPDLAYDT